LKKLIPWWVMGESLLGLAQMVKGGSLGGIMWWLGERTFNISTIGVAQISVLGQGLIRAYGTFSHPNSLAGFLLVSLGLWVTINPSALRAAPLDRGALKIKNIYWWMVVWTGILGIIVSGSRTVWGLTLLMLMIYFVQAFKARGGVKIIAGYTAIILGIFLLVLGLMSVNYQISDFLGGWDINSLMKRTNLSVAAVKMWRENLMIGVGAGNFIPRLPEYQPAGQATGLQPVHNIFLLAGTEVGVVGILIVVKLLITNYELKIKKKYYLILGIIIITGLVDHYWITLSQNRWLLAIVLGII
jgi:hypothetical protein